MHIGNEQFLRDMSVKFPQYFNGVKVLELGALNINGTARVFFQNCEYVGIDQTMGPDVDIQVAAKDTCFQKEYFDTLITMSMFEHDPTWKQSFEHNLQWLRPEGMYIACWGAEGNIPHAPEPWAAVPVQEMRDFVKTLPLMHVDIFFEGDRYHPDCPGAWDMIAFKKSVGMR